MNLVIPTVPLVAVHCSSQNCRVAVQNFFVKLRGNATETGLLPMKSIWGKVSVVAMLGIFDLENRSLKNKVSYFDTKIKRSILE